MKDIRILPFSWYRDIAELTSTFKSNFFKHKGDFSFLTLLEPALIEVEDETIITLLYNVSTRYSIQIFLPSYEFLTLNDIYLIREYVKRRLKTLKEEKEAERILR